MRKRNPPGHARKGAEHAMMDVAAASKAATPTAVSRRAPSPVANDSSP